MSRWEPDARGRLQRAALDLYSERGFDDATVAEIAERAGLTKRTYFRYFTDKREVLFWGSEIFQETILAGTAAAPPSASPLEAVVAGLQAAAAQLFGPERRPDALRRAQIIAATPELQERELIKRATLSAELAGALRERGVGEPTATLAADAGVTVFWVAFARWVASDGERELDDLVAESRDGLRAATAP